MEAERDVVDLYRAVLMRDRIGEEYDGTIAAVVGFGLFVQIESPFVEGLVKLGALTDDHYEYDEETQRLVGQSTGRQFALGDPVKVRIENVSVPGRKIDLALVEHTATAPPVRDTRSSGRRRDDKRKPLRPAPSRGGKHDRGGKHGGGGKPRRRRPRRRQERPQRRRRQARTPMTAALSTMRYEVTGRVARITLDRPARGNGITLEMPRELAACVEQANLDPAVHVILLSGNGKGFCGGYDLVESAERLGTGVDGDVPPGSPIDPAVMARNHDPRATWDPIVDYQMMSRNVRGFMSLFRSDKPVVCKVHGFCVAGGTDMALCSDLLVIEDRAKIGYPPARVWGVPTTALWTARLGPQHAKRLLFTGDCLSGTEAVRVGPGARGAAARRARRAHRGAGRAHRARAGQPAHHAQAARQPAAPGRARPDADPRHRVRRHRAPHARGLRVPAARRHRRLQRGGPRARRPVRRRRPVDVQGLTAITDLRFPSGARRRDATFSCTH